MYCKGRQERVPVSADCHLGSLALAFRTIYGDYVSNC